MCFVYYRIVCRPRSIQIRTPCFPVLMPANEYSRQYWISSWGFLDVAVEMLNYFIVKTKATNHPARRCE